MTTTAHIEREVGDEYPSVPFTWYDYDEDTDTDVIADLSTDWTGTVRITSPDEPGTVLVVATGCVLAATAPNHVWTPTAADDAAIVDAWGKPLPERGAVFVVEPFLALTATPSTNRRWNGPKVTMRIKPAATLPT